MSAPSRRYLSVWLRRLPTDRIAKRYPPDALVVAAPVKSALRLSAVNDAAAKLGLRVGMPLADARAMYPKLNVADADEAADLALLEAVADWCDRYTPLVGLDAPDGLTLDISGCAHLFGGEAALANDLVRRLTDQGLQARVAIADTVGCAWGVARFFPTLPPPERGRSASETSRVGVSSDRRPPTRSASRIDLPLSGGGIGEIVASGEEREALSPLPLAALRLPAETIEALSQVGLKRVTDVLDFPRAPLAARFGAEFVRRLDQALGREDEPIAPRLPIPAAITEQRFAEPIALERDVLGTIEKLAGKLSALLERRGEGARLLQTALFRTDGKVFRIDVGLSEPLRDPARIRHLFADRLGVIGDEIDPGFGYDMLRLAALVTERCAPAQTGLAQPDHAAELAHLIDRLGARFGLRRITRFVEQDTHIPEFAVAAVPAHMARSLSPPPPAKRWGGPSVAVLEGKNADAEHRLWNAESGSRGGGTFVRNAYPPPSTPPCHSLRSWGEGIRTIAATVEHSSHAPTRPIRLFAHPEPIDAIAELPDGPPAQFTWRETRHVVLQAEGPERIAMEWWRDRSGLVLMRDYFRVESREGLRVWIYRSGPRLLEDKEREDLKREFVLRRTIGWFVHGVFA